MLNGRTELHIFDRGSVTGDRYYEEVLLPYVRLFQGAIGLDFIFMDDNARPHWTLAVEELLESEDITRMDWPAFSPDLNPIEHVWDALGRRIAARLHHPENTQHLKQMLIEEWALLPQEMLHQLVLSMRRWCEATIANSECKPTNVQALLHTGTKCLFVVWSSMLVVLDVSILRQSVLAVVDARDAVRYATVIPKIWRSSLSVEPRGYPKPGLLEAVPSLDHCYQQSCTVDTFRLSLSAISRKENPHSRCPITQPR
ncbi:transposable element Tcb2 transposase [Trichonephila clavipes]|nr:transposable element Tcb2 transposase [Trichonephila clavipes]